MSMLRGPLRYGPDLQAVREQVAQTVGAPEELHLGSQAAGLGGNCYKSSARVSNKRRERHVRCAKQEQCREDTL